MKKKNLHIIVGIEPGSIADECGLEAGDAVVSVNEHVIEDIFDYQFYIEEAYLELEILTKDGEAYILEIEKDEDEDLGILFENSLMDEYHSCCNKCIFCFIDQMPPGMRDTLYFKDDDSRLSFLQGNYITLTNMKDKDLDRIIKYHLAPINISVHATNPELRCQMLHNRFAGNILERIQRLADAGIPMNSQVVLCKGINDGEELDRTIRELSAFLPYMESLSVVPVGITKYREHLEHLESFGKEDAVKVIAQIQGWQKNLKAQYGNCFVHASDEWFIMAGQEFPPEEYYEGYGQLENGVGMMRLLIEEVQERLADFSGDDRSRKVTIATAKLAYPTICALAKDIQAKFPKIEIQVRCIINHFFGEKITVSGLLTGQDIRDQLLPLDLGDEVLLPVNVLKADEDIFLDDISLEELSGALQIPVNVIESEGQDFVDKIIGRNYFVDR